MGGKLRHDEAMLSPLAAARRDVVPRSTDLPPDVETETPAIETLSVHTARRLHPWPVRIMHWVNVVVMLIMITSGWGLSLIHI